MMALPDAAMIADQRIAELASVPLAAASSGDRAALCQIGLDASTIGFDPSASLPAEARFGLQYAAVMLCRVAAWNGGEDAAYALALTLTRLATFETDATARVRDLGEGLAWMHRAAEAGHADAARLIDLAHPDDEEMAAAIRVAAEFEKRLPAALEREA